MNWLTVTYQPTTLFSLKPSWATSSGGKSLLLPSPYSLKMALLDAAIRTSGLATAQSAWAWLRDLPIGIQLPHKIVVTNVFAKILRKNEIKVKAVQKAAAIAVAMQKQQWPYKRTIGYREYVYYPAPISFVFGLGKQVDEAQLADWLCQISYLGKRGGLVQLLTPPALADGVGEFLLLTADPPAIPTEGIVQQLDDCGAKMRFAHADIYDSKRPVRVTRHLVIPYRPVRSSKSYTLYQRIEAEG